MTVNFLNKSKADELKARGFNYTVQRIGDGNNVYVFVRTPDLMKIIAGKFSESDFYIGKTLNF